MAKGCRRKDKSRIRQRINTSKSQQLPDYSDGKIHLHEEVTRPSYEDVAGWLQHCEGRNIAFDFWARGNYTRRLIYHRNHNIEPLLVQVSYVDELRWAYRRLALLGLPVDFIFSGHLTKPSKVLHVSRREAVWDSGWGYLATLWEERGQYYAAIIGHARLMPETVIDWLIDETSEDFIAGKVFVAPAELIGINHRQTTEGLSKLAGITKGALMSPNYEIARVAMELAIPFLDNMSPLAFRKFVRDYEGELVQFQRAFKNLVIARAKSEDQLKECLEELKYEIAELTKAAKHQGTRNSIAKLGGVLTTFTVSLAIAMNAQPASTLHLLGVAGLAAATKALLDLYTQATEHEKNMDNPYFILWKLGMARPSEVKVASKIDIMNAPRLPYEKLALNSAHHWLCPPTPGVRFLAVTESEDK